MPREKQNATDASVELAKRITEALARERVVPRFVDSYVVENGRHALQVHASLYRDLLALLQREALLARAAETRRRRKPFEAADHPFVDRCAFLLDSSFMENARLAASRALTGIEELAAQIVAAQGQSPPNSRPH